MTHPSARDLTPLAERLGLLQAFRVVAVLAVLAVPPLTGDSPAGLVPLAGAYLGLTLVVEALRRAGRQRWLKVVAGTLLLDGAFLALATTLTGGGRSPLIFLMCLDVLAVTLLASYRTGLKIAIWSALLLFVGQASVRAGWLTSVERTSDEDAALGAAALLVVAIAAAAFSAVNERALRASRGQLLSIVDLDAELARAATARTVATAIARASATRLGFRRVVAVVRHDDGWVQATASADGTVDTSLCGPPTGVEASLDPSRPHLVRALDPDGSLAALMPDAESVVIAPVAADGEALGVVAAEWGGRDHAHIPGTTVDSLARSANHAALALRHHTLLSEVERLATHDPLTGLANRRVFEETLERELARAVRTGQSLTLLVVDVDRFKQVNDVHGHPVGDQVLRSVAAALASNTKGFDLVVRLGGDEFAVILPNCTLDDAVAVADRLRVAVAEETGPDYPVTVSVGWAVGPVHALHAMDLLAAADDGLYAAKRAGRDCSRGAPRRAQRPTSDPATMRRRR